MTATCPGSPSFVSECAWSRASALGHLIRSFGSQRFGQDAESACPAPSSPWSYPPTFQMAFQMSPARRLGSPQTEHFPQDESLIIFTKPMLPLGVALSFNVCDLWLLRLGVLESARSSPRFRSPLFSVTKSHQFFLPHLHPAAESGWGDGGAGWGWDTFSLFIVLVRVCRTSHPHHALYIATAEPT